MKKLDLGKEKIGKLLFAFSIPCIISMLINSIYNIVDQVFIGQGVGTIGNAATNVIFPLVIICNAVAGLIGNGCAAELSLKLGEGNSQGARKSVGSSITILFFISLILAVLGQLFLPILIQLFGCTPNVYESAMTYGRVILIGAPFVIIYSGLSNIIRADGSPKYSMICLVVGAIINLILDPIFIFGFGWGVAGGAWATVIGQFVSFIIATVYIKKIKSVHLTKQDFIPHKSVFKTLSLGLSSFITQLTVLALFVVMNNLMTRYGMSSKFGADIPLSVYGVVSKVNSLFISSILGIAIGAQPIIGFNYGAGNYARVKETLKKVFTICFIVGLAFNVIFHFFPKEILLLFIKNTDPSYALFMEFGIDCFQIFLMICAANSMEMCSSISIQSLGNVKKATAISFMRQIILFIPLALILCNQFGVYGALYAGPIADALCFIFVIFVFGSEYKKVLKLERNQRKEEIVEEVPVMKKTNLTKPIVITISREYGSGGRYIGQLLAKKLNIPCYDKELIHLTAKEAGFQESFVAENEETRKAYYGNNDAIFLAEAKVVQKLAKQSCVIVGRCSDYILRNHKNVIRVFIYSDEDSKIKRVSKHYGIASSDVAKEIKERNQERAKHYKYYTDTVWDDTSHYDILLHSDALGVEKTAILLEEFVYQKQKEKNQ